MANDVPDRMPPASAADAQAADVTAADASSAAAKKPIPPAAQRALAEAAARRAEHERNAREQPKEIQGRGGLDPVRYGDWEVNGAASDF